MPWFPRTRKGKQHSSTTSEPNSPSPTTNPHLPQSTETETSLVLAEPPAENPHDALSRNPNIPRTLPHNPSPSTNPTNPLKRINKYGLLPLHIPSSDDGPASENTFPIDIVAVHGITGDAYNTWEDKESKTLWLRDFLPDELPGARIYTYGYRAEVLFSRGTGDVKSFANGLLGDLGRVRRGVEDQRRPIIFICHSMGGIVVKKALNLALVDSEWHENVRTSTFAIMFLATPHRGSDSADILSFLARIANVGLKGTNRFTGRIRSGLIKTLEKESAELKDIAGDFRSNLREIKVASFIEQEMMMGSNKRIVDESTGLMDTAGERRVDMEGCSHTSICRFGIRTDVGYERVLHVLMEYAREATNKVIEELTSEDIPCLRSLAFREMTNRQHEADKAHPNTCHWILQHTSYNSWMRQSHGLLWVKGNPGTGKSTLMAFIFRTFQQMTGRHVTLDFFFHRRGTALQKSREGMFRSLLHQIYSQTQAARAIVLKAFQEKRGFGEPGLDWQWQLNELENLFFRAVIEVAKVREVAIFVDALDEAIQESGEKAAGNLVEFFHRLNDRVISDGGSAKICISCRHYPVVASMPGLEIRVEDENEMDIWSFVHSQFIMGVVFWSQDLSQADAFAALEAAIVRKAAGVFLWAILQVPKLLKRLNDGRSIVEIYQFLDAESNELVDLYKSILKNDIDPGDQREALHLMQWICLAERPLSVTELRFALACDDESIRPEQVYCEESNVFVESDLRMQKLTMSLSGGLAEVKYYDGSSTVQFVHQTVIDFLLSSGLRFLFQRSTESAASLIKDVIGLSEQRLSRSCINYLKLGDVVREDRAWTEAVRRDLPFIDYAIKNWPLHAERAERHGFSQEGIVKQFEYPPETFQTWVTGYNVVDKLCPRSPSPDTSLIHVAATSNLQSTVRFLLQEGDSIEAEDTLGNTPLHFAARWGHKELVRMLLDLNANIQAKNTSGSTPLEWAAGNGHRDVVQLLINRGAKVNEKTGVTSTALQSACEKGNLTLVRMLIENGADVNLQGGQMGNALQAAASGRSAEVVELLIANGADINAVGGYYGTALQAVVLLILPPACEVLVKRLLSMGAHVNAQGGQYGTALQAAATTKRTEIVRLLLECEADVRLTGGEYGNALQAAAAPATEDSLELVQLLLERGAEVNEQGGYYGNALQAAAAWGREETVRLLLSKGAGVNTPGGRFGNALQAAAYSGSKGVIQILLEHGADLHARGGEYGTAIQAATFSGNQKGNRAVVQFLLDKGADINAGGGEQGSVLQVAMFQPSEEFVKFLLDQGANVNAPGGPHGNPLQAAIYWGRASFVQLLLERGADVNALVAGQFINCIQVAAYGGKIEIVKILIDEGADVNMQGGWYGNALQVATMRGHAVVVKLLLESGADVNAEGGMFGSALNAAGLRRDIVKILLDAGARQVNVEKLLSASPRDDHLPK